MPEGIVDTHIHVWDFTKAEYDWLNGDASILNRTYSIEEISHDRKEAGVSEGLLVQAANNLDDTNWMLELAKKVPWISGVVGWLPLLHPKQTDSLLHSTYTGNNYFKGVRHLIHNEATPQWLLQDAVIDSLRILSASKIPYDVVGIIPAHIETALSVAAKVPGLRMVFDHMNQPPIFQQEKFGKWGALLKEAAANPAFFIKISGLGTACKNPSLWNERNIRPYIEFILEQFGPDRCFCGSDWPVSLLAGGYTKTWDIYKNVLSSILPVADQEKVLFSSAKSFYGL